MLTLKVGGSDLKTIVDAFPQANVGLEYGKKQLVIATAAGISFTIVPKIDPKNKGRLLLTCPWKDIRMAGVKAGWGAQKLWPKIQTALASTLGDLKTSNNLPDGMFELRKNDEYCGVSVDIRKLRNSIGTFTYEGLMFRLASFAFNDDNIEVSFSVEDAPQLKTRETDEDVPDEDVPDGWDFDD